MNYIDIDSLKDCNHDSLINYCSGRCLVEKERKGTKGKIVIEVRLNDNLRFEPEVFYRDWYNKDWKENIDV